MVSDAYCRFTSLILTVINRFFFKSSANAHFNRVILCCILKLYYSAQWFGIPLRTHPHIFSEMFSSSADRKQFHLHENSVPPLPPLPQHHLLFLRLPFSFSQFKHIGRLLRHNPGVCGSPLNISSSERSGGPTGAEGRVQRRAGRH